MNLYRNMRVALSRSKKDFFDRLTRMRWSIHANRMMRETLKFKECYYGPYTGEFGHLLGHNLPFICYLHSMGVKVHFCGMDIHRPFFVDEYGNEIVASYVELGDFFGKSFPNCNKADTPDDVKDVVTKFIEKARNSKLPYWDNSDFSYYFSFFRWWILKHKYLKTHNLSSVYKTDNSDTVVIFPRKFNTHVDYQKQLRNNGEKWDYYKLARIASRYFEKVYLIGHPAFSAVDFGSFDNVEVCITNDNKQLLEICSNSKLIISQHSGSVYLGEYTNTPVLIIYKGGRVIGDIEDTRKFNQGLGSRQDFNYAFDYNEIEKFFNTIAREKVRN